MDIDSITPPSDEHLAAIGSVTNTWAMVEFFLSYTLGALITEDGEFYTSDSTVAILTNGMAAATTIGLLRTLARERHRQDFKKFSKLCDDLIKAKKNRDNFAHAFWTQRPDGKIEPYLIKTVGSIRRAKGAHTVEDIKNHSEHMMGLIRQLAAFQVRWEIFPPLPGKEPQ